MRDTTHTTKTDVRVTNKILADLERGNLTWLQPWHAGHRAGLVSRPWRAGGQPYRGINVLMLWAAAIEKGYGSPLWLTYRQAAELGGQVRKGETGSLVVYANTFTKLGTDANGADTEIEIPFMKGYSVFNAEQIDGLPGHFYATQPPLNAAINRLDAVESFFANTRATIQHGGNREPVGQPTLDLAARLIAGLDAEPLERVGRWDDDPAPPALLHHQPGKMHKPVVLDRVRQQPAGQIRGRTRPEGTKPDAVLQCGHMALSVPLRGEIVLD
jgi:hypothetical protein